MSGIFKSVFGAAQGVSSSVRQQAQTQIDARAPGETPEAPTASDTEIDEAKRAERERGKRGRLSTLVTGPQGLSDESLSISRKTLLGS